MPTVVFDLDGVIAYGTVEDVYSDEAGWAYEKCDPAIETIRAMRLIKDQVKIVIHTARPIVELEKTKEWLARFNVPYDELIMGKPFGQLYIDDRSFIVPFRFEDWGARGLARAILEHVEKVEKVEHGKG